MAENRAPAVRRVLGRAGAAGVLFAVLGGSPALAQTTPPPSVKYFVVPHPDHPDDVTLFKIAERALGDGWRFPEIFRLNQGRPRPDGTPFTDPAAIEPGQVLRLPDDAGDPAARSGTRPAAPPAAPAAKPTPEPSALGAGLASAVSGTGGLVTGLIAGLWLRRRPRRVPSPPAEPAGPREDDDGSGSVSGTLPVVAELPRVEPVSGEHAIIVLDTAETQVIAAVRPGSRFHFRLGGDTGSAVLVAEESERP